MSDVTRTEKATRLKIFDLQQKAKFLESEAVQLTLSDKQL